MTPEEPGLSRLEMLHFARRVVEKQARVQLEQIDGWIAAEQQRAADRARRLPPKPPPDFVVQHGVGRGGRPIGVHHGYCTPLGVRVKEVAPDDARRLIAEDGDLACPLCRPDSTLGM